MEKQEILDLIDRIKIEPSVLFWGQNYLSSLSGKNIFYERVAEELCDHKLLPIVNYSILWNEINNGDVLTDKDLQNMQNIVNEIPIQNWIRQILKMHWGMVMTSAVDTIMLHCVGSAFGINCVGYERKTFSRELVSKSLLHGCFIYGNIDDIDETLPRKYDKKTEILMKKQTSERISWIYDDILKDYGVLVIDGWNPETDWMKDLLQNATQMPEDSIYLFGAGSEIYKNDTIELLVEMGILHVEVQTFAQILAEIGYFAEEDGEEWEQNEDVRGKLVTIKAEKDPVYLNIPSSEISKLGHHITLLYDDIWKGKETERAEIKKQYAQFLTQTGKPIWSLYTPKYGFYFDRDVDEKLYSAVDREMKKTGTYNRNAIILEGNSNTGKTTALVNLAYKLMYKAPVLFISGNPEHNDYSEKIKNFIKNQILEKQSKGKWIENVVVIWDGNRDYDSASRCIQLQKKLLECNVIVVGSSYRTNQQKGKEYKDHAGNNHLLISAMLSKKETKKMLKVIENIDREMSAQLEYSIKKTKCDTKDAYLLYYFQKLARFEFSSEWRAVETVLKSRFHDEVKLNEDASDEALQKYKEEYIDRVEKEIVTRGAASEFQLVLRDFAKKNGFHMNEDLSGQPEKIKELFKLNKDIQILNKVLALAGEFSAELPLTLLLRIMGGNSSLLSKEKIFINKVLQSDSLLFSYRDDQGYMMVSFRHPSEAELYIRENLGDDPESIKNAEVKLLYEIIETCDWKEEAKSVLTLVRRFGPNSFGKYSEENTMNGHYNEYQEWWTRIAFHLREYANGNAEAALVYAHLIRSDFEFNKRTELLSEAESVLQDIIDAHDRIRKSQYCRLLGEICANLAVSLQEIKGDEAYTKFVQLKRYFADAVRNWVEKDSQSLYTTNALLDTWLNGVTNYINATVGAEYAMKDQTCRDAVADSLHYIDLLLDLSEDEFEQIGLLRKIDKIYKISGNGDLDAIASKLRKENNDTYLFLQARNCWVMEKSEEKEENDPIGVVCRNLYMLPDDADRFELFREKLSDLKESSRKAAEQVIVILEENRTLIERSKSARCMYMLFRAKWLVYTGYLPFEAKQRPELSREQWKEIAELCKKYILYEGLSSQRIKPAPLMIRMVYLWVYTDDKNEIYDLQNRLKSLLRHDWFFERIGLCRESTRLLRYFYVNLSRRPMDKRHNAFVCEEVNGEGKCSNLLRKAIHVPDSVLTVLLDGQKADQIYQIKKSVVIWFNSKGPQLGLPGSESEA